VNRELPREMAEELLRAVKGNFVKSNPYPSTSPSVLKSPFQRFIVKFPRNLAPKIRSRTGRLKDSFKVESAPPNGARVVTFSPYAHINEFGGVVKPSRRKYLTIPLNKEAWESPATAFKNVVIKRGVIFKRLGRQRYKPLYLLVKKVELKPIGYAQSVIKEKEDRIFSRVFKKFFVRA